MKTEIRKIAYKGWENCIELSNGIVSLIITTDVGPRIMHYGFVNDRNEFNIWENQLGQTGGDEWKCYGGTRLWHGPEIGQRCYEPDNDPVSWDAVENGVLLKQNEEPVSHIAKEMSVSLNPDKSEVDLRFKLTNSGMWNVELCIWILSLLEGGGLEIIPRKKYIADIPPNGILPNGAIAYWPYTNMGDSRLRISDEYILLQHDRSIKQSFKIGLPVEDGWAAYINDGHMFVKQYTHIRNAIYPDYCSSFETYLNDSYTEMETLSPMRVLAPGESIEHFETWKLFDGIRMPDTEADIGSLIHLIK